MWLCALEMLIQSIMGMQVTAEVQRALKQAPLLGPQGMGASPALTGFEVRCLSSVSHRKITTREACRSVSYVAMCKQS